MAGQGHRTSPHTADLLVEAWAPTREECLAEAIRGVVGSFARTAGATASQTAVRHVGAESDEDLLVAVIDEVIYLLDTGGLIPVLATVLRASDGGVDLDMSLASVGSVRIVGAVPKAASLHDLRCAPDRDGWWSCRVVVDV